MPIGGFQSGFTPLSGQLFAGTLSRNQIGIQRACKQRRAVINLVSGDCNRSSEFQEARAIYQLWECA
jgi:hypothetical protein